MIKRSGLAHGAVIMFDGPEWIGKTTQVGLAASALTQKGFKVWTTRVNGGTPIGEALRKVMLDNFERPIMTDLHIHLAQQYALQIELERRRSEDAIILIDRSPLSIIAYEVFGGGLEPTVGYQAAREVMKAFKPELLIAYQAPIEILKGRHTGASHPTDYYEKKPPDYFKRVAKGYKEASAYFSALTIDASGDVDAVHAETMRQISKLVK